ncbi:glycerophosphoryl diester phosphodiesterase membrane domain-containing protein [Erythrobacter sp. EC-HK427]|uniref:glycerophosphoryl diester phosphodiesterase membrane domain-containing protein n=1 Tax=Erythrobacter sp. EC-HK427 TaxID=2038396 RepID=UPI00125AF656|nr:glycerophosphoryl diester phosphodiesterase membrane domain-containing protein [Erythrobacter sp. EC-HK427]VVS97102.1 conserved membrane hypothetical protein [Erythrobacter sp. EC-HK427]
MELNIGQVISNAFGMVKQRFAGLLGVWAIYFVIQIVLMFVLFGAIGSTVFMAGLDGMGAQPDPLALGVGAILLLIVSYFALIVLAFASQISLAHHASPLLSPDIASSFKAGIRSILTVLGLVLLFIVGYIIIAVALGILVAIMSVAGDFGSTLGAIAAMLVVLWLVCRLILTMPIIAVEGERNPINAITRSWALTSGNALRIFLAVLVFAVLLIVLAMIVGAVLGGGLAATMAGAGGTDSIAALSGGVIFAVLVFGLISAVSAMIMSSFVSALHAGLSPTASVSATFE